MPRSITSRPAKDKKTRAPEVPATPATKGKRTRHRILDEAAHHFAARGYSGTGIGEIMSACGLTKGGFYSHFASKEALYLETVRALLEREKAKYQRAPETATPEIRLKAFLDWMRESMAGDRPLGRQFLWMVLEPDSTVTSHVIEEVFHSTYSELRSLLELARGEAHPEIMASSLLAIALLHEQIKAKIMRPLARKKALAFDTAQVLELMLDPKRARGA